MIIIKKNYLGNERNMKISFARNEELKKYAIIKINNDQILYFASRHITVWFLVSFSKYNV
jgi:hypothetical protein